MSSPEIKKEDVFTATEAPAKRARGGHPLVRSHSSQEVIDGSQSPERSPRPTIVHAGSQRTRDGSQTTHFKRPKAVPAGGAGGGAAADAKTSGIDMEIDDAKDTTRTAHSFSMGEEAHITRQLARERSKLGEGTTAPPPRPPCRYYR